ncbi:MAG: glycosyltransferase family 4 protein [Clostridia bacterium]|nr:glycosyltransferase family 4 protein [Clostridia bacterium]
MSFKDLKRIVSEFKKNSPDIIHIHGLQSEGFVGTLCAKIFGKAKILITVHGMQHDSFNIGVFKKFLFKNILERWTLKNADGVFCVCEAAEKSKYISKNTKHLMHYLHNCVSDMPEYVRETERENLGFKKDDIVLVSVGRVTEGKGAAVVANIIENDKNNNHKYLILGDGPYLKTMKERLAEQISKGKVVFMGSVSDVGRYLSASDVYISATYKENLSIAILEAGYYSLPCIVTPVGGNGEIIENGYNGELFDIEDVDGFFDKLNCILKTGIDKYRANAKENINQRFSIEQFEKGLCDIYNKILDNN